MRPERLLGPVADPHELLQPRLAAVIESSPRGERRLRLPLALIDAATELLIEHRGRFVGLFLVELPEPSLMVTLAFRGELVSLRSPLDGATEYPSLARLTPAALLPEEEIHDRFGLVPLGHPLLERVLRPDPDELPRRVSGEGTFVMPYGPIRSGVFESIQFVIETGGEDVLALQVRPFFKHRGLEQLFAGRGYDQAVLIAERVAGIASVAHASAFCQSLERGLGVDPPERGQRWRVVHAELERIANHLDVATRLAEDAALAVGVARFGILKEQVMRLRARLCGTRFGRGAVIPGGVSEPLLGPGELLRELDRFDRDLARDRRLLLATTSFTDRLYGSGTLDAATVEAYAGVGPVARASGIATDARFERPYGAYTRFGATLATAEAGDAMARLQVRFDEIEQSLHLIRQSLERLDKHPTELRVELPAADVASALGWAEAPMGEVVYWTEVVAGRVATVRIASPSLRNWPLFAESFRGDVLTDFSFIEHSFGLTPAGADR